MWIVLFATWLGTALAAVPVELPPGESAAAWAEPARLAGAHIGSAAGAPSARVVANGGRWTIYVLARDGTRHTLVVAAPTSAAAREDLLATVVSLAEPVSAALPGVPLPPVPLPPVPAPVKPAPKPSPSPTKASPPAPKPSPLPPAAPSPAAAPEGPDGVALTGPTALDAAEPGEPDVVAPAAPEAAEPATAEATEPPAPDAEEPVPEEPSAAAEPPDEPRRPLLDLDTPEEPARRRVPLHARVSTGAVVRLDAAPAPIVELAGGVGLGPVRVGLAVAGAPAAALDDERAMAWLDAALLAEAGDLGPWGALRVGVAARGWSEAAEPVTTTATPTARLDLGWGFAVGPSARFRPGVWGAVDLAPTTLYVAGIEERELDRGFFGLDVGFEIFRAEK